MNEPDTAFFCQTLLPNLPSCIRCIHGDSPKGCKLLIASISCNRWMFRITYIRFSSPFKVILLMTAFQISKYLSSAKASSLQSSKFYQYCITLKTRPWVLPLNKTNQLLLQHPKAEKYARHAETTEHFALHWIPTVTFKAFYHEI